MNIIDIAIGLFILAAVIGIYLLSLILRKKETRKGLVFIHGPLAGLALVIVIVNSIMTENTKLIGPIFVFVMAALGGGVLVYKDLTGHRPPAWLGILHGLIAVTGLIYLIISY